MGWKLPHVFREWNHEVWKYKEPTLNTGHIEAKDDFRVNSWNSWTKYGTITVFFGDQAMETYGCFQK